MMRSAFRAAAALLALGIFLIDTLTPLEGAVAVLYVVVVLLAARTSRRGDILAAAAASIALTVAAYVDSHGLAHAGSPTLRALVSLSAIGITAALALQNQRATDTLTAQARLLNLSHDMIFVRDQFGVIAFWNSTAEEVYGWRSREAVGRVADELLETSYSEPRETIEASLFETGRWDGTLRQKTKLGDILVVESRWAVQRDRLGRPVGVLETHTDITDRQAAHAALVQSERRYRRMFDASRIGVVQEDWTEIRAELRALGLSDSAALGAHLAGHPEFVERARRLAKIVDVNPAFLAMVAAGSSSRFLESVDEILSETDRTFTAALAAFARGETSHEGETEIIRLDGRRIPVLFAITFPSVDDHDANVLVFVIDNTERKQAQDALLAAQAELAHAARVATLGELTASIAHEVNQPLMSVVTSGEAGMRWLRREKPDLHEVETAIERIISEGRRASEIVKRIRAFLTKAPAQHNELSVAAIIDEASLLVQRELARERVELCVEIEPDLPSITGDRIQLQQVLVNLMVNAGQAMADQPGPRLLSVGATRPTTESLVVTIGDSGPGIAAGDIERLFSPFFTTKKEGMGMGLAICRTTTEAHGGTLSVESVPGNGATFRLTLPVLQIGTAP
ncbi:PAS domain S-box protein (plasmid) [Bosea sp. F3-2]|uniref:PAS domain-containing sensor histidine kinase n=1 Tax=Bosea sp. F3-2 TaxID=2599640 RepID=UPI0011EBC8C5|nr:ATP-binding protein [Bosea sp. F3-2]QEL26927.1 PAS domain S-box protein [Bosea sp. F3-2]